MKKMVDGWFRGFKIIACASLLLLGLSANALAIQPGFSDDMESGPTKWQSAGGMWHLTTVGTDPCATANSGNTSWYFGQESTCNYDDGQIARGSLVSQPIYVPETSPVLSFWSYEETECGDGGCGYDFKYVFISANGGQSWTRIATLNHENEWYQVDLDLSAYAGQTVNIRFTFDTGDDYANDFHGWNVDDVSVTGAPPDYDAPASAIVSPADGTTVGNPCQVAGIASDNGGSGVDRVEVSTDGGQSWSNAAGTNSWSFEFIPGEVKTFTITSRATDKAGNAETPGQGVTVDVASLAPADMGNALGFVPGNYASLAAQAVNIPVGGSGYTTELWIKPRAMGTKGMLGWGYYGNPNATNALRFNNYAILNYWWGADLNGATGNLVGEWHHIAATWDGLTRTLYLDGRAVASDNPAPLNVPYADNLTIGATNDLAEMSDCIMDEVRIWGVARTQAEVAADMYKPLAGDEPGLAAYYNFNQGIPGGDNGLVTTLADQTVNNNACNLNNFALGGPMSNFVADDMFMTQTTVLGTGTVTSTTAMAGASITKPGVSPVAEAGFCWGTSPMPNLADSHVTATIGSSFQAQITGLTPATTYYVRAYTTDSLGTYYSNNESLFTTYMDETDAPATKVNGGVFEGALAITGIANDSGSGVALVEVSLDGGATWAPATDTSYDGSWSTWSFGVPGPGSYLATSRATDHTGNVEPTDPPVLVAVELYAGAIGEGLMLAPATSGWIEIGNFPDNSIYLEGTDNAHNFRYIPFDFNYYGNPYNTAFASTNGLLGFTEDYIQQYEPSPIPTQGDVNNMIAAAWGDLDLFDSGSAYSATVGVEPNRTFVVEWVNAEDLYSGLHDKTFEVLLHEGTNEIEILYKNNTGQFNSSVVGIENADGTEGIQVPGNQLGNGIKFVTNNPYVTVVSPTPGLNQLDHAQVIQGTASDLGSGVAIVFVSLDGGASWLPATTEDNWATWSFSGWTPDYGNYTLMVGAIDKADNNMVTQVNFSLVEDAPPVLTIPPDITAEANGMPTILDIGTATAIDINDGSLPVTNDAPVDGFGLNTSTVTWTATDSYGNTVSATQYVTIVDTIPPTITAPPDITTEGTGEYTSVDLGEPVVADSGSGVYYYYADNTGPFQFGTTNVLWHVYDERGNGASAMQHVTIVDTTPPSIAPPKDITIAAVDLGGAIVDLGTPSADDFVSGIASVTSSIPSGSTFPIGVTVVTWTATDGSGNVATATQKVTVTYPPVLIGGLDPNPPVTATAGTLVTWTASASGGMGGPYQYRFLRYGPDTASAYVEVQPWGASDTCNWTPTTAQIGNNYFQVKVKNPDGSGAAYMISGMYKVLPAALAADSITPSPASPGVAGNTVTWTAAASGGKGVYLYSFWRSGPDTAGAYVVAQGWGASDAWSWTPDATQKGNNYVMVKVKNADGSGAAVYKISSMYKVNLAPITITSFGTATSSPVTAGAQVTWNAAATGGSGSYLYSFWRMGPDTAGVYVPAQAWDPSSSYTWDTTTAASGLHYFVVKVKNLDGTGAVYKFAPAMKVQ